MCPPVFAAAAILSTIATTASSVMSVKANNDAAKAEMANASASTEQQYQQLREQQIQVNDQAALEKLERQRQALRDRAKIRVSQAEAGITGNTAERELNDAAFQESYDLSIMEANRSNAISQSVTTGRAIGQEGLSRWKSAKNKRISGLSAGLQIGGAALSSGMQGYAGYSTIKKG